MLPFNHIYDENEFRLTLYNLFEHENIVQKRDHIEKYKNLIFDPHKFNDVDDGFEYNSSSNYYDNIQFNDIVKNHKNDFSLLNVNIRSLYRNYESFKDFISNCDINFKIIGLVETWFKDKPSEYFHINGFNLEIKNRPNKKGGGVCFYINDGVKYKVRTDLDNIKHPENTETLFIEIERTKAKNIVIGVVYKPPDQDISTFNSFMENMLCKLRLTYLSVEVLYICNYPWLALRAHPEIPRIKPIWQPGHPLNLPSVTSSPATLSTSSLHFWRPWR